MLEQYIVDSLKQKYGKIYLFTYLNREYVFRQITIGEFKKIVKGLTTGEEDFLVKEVVVYPESVDIDILPAGFASSILNEACKKSGFDDPENVYQLFEEKRKKLSMIIYAMEAFVLSAQNITKKELQNYTLEELIEEVAFTEKIIEIQSAIANPSVETITFDIPNPEETISEEDPLKKKLLEALKTVTT